MHQISLSSISKITIVVITFLLVSIVSLFFTQNAHAATIDETTLISLQVQVKKLEQLVATLKTSLSPKLFTISKISKKGISIEQGQSDVEFIKINVLPQKEDTYLNTVYVEVSSPQKKTSIKPWDSLQGFTLWSNDMKILSKDLSEKDNWIITKDKKGKEVYRVKVYVGNYKIPAGKKYTLSARLSVVDVAKVGSIWNVSVPLDGVETWTNTNKHKKQGIAGQAARIIIKKKVDHSYWMYEQGVGIFVSKIEGTYTRAEWYTSVLRSQGSPLAVGFADLVLFGRERLDAAQKALSEGEYDKASQYAKEAQDPLLLIVNTYDSL